jgi:serpin B
MVAVVTATLLAACGEVATAPRPRDPGPSPSEPRVEPVVDRPSPDSPDVEALVAGLNEVGYDLFQVAADQSADDVVLSPLSIGVAFGMADAGASGGTAGVLTDLFANPVEGEARWSAFNSLEQSVTRRRRASRAPGQPRVP